MNRVAIVDYDLCNLDSVARAVEECGASAAVTADPADLRRADRIILPGVGAFPDAMAHLRGTGMAEALTDEVLGAGAPFLGICLGMQLLASASEEVTPTPGLGWFAGTVRRLQPTDEDPLVPHVGWNEVWPTGDFPLLDGVPPGSDFYFVHSYHVVADDPGDVAATTPYTGGFASALWRGNVFATQFHPEKSQRHGFTVLQNFLAV